MASNNVEDFRNFDWDDTALIKAYNKGTKLRENGYKKPKNPRKGNSSKENVKAGHQWKVGNYCRAEYSADQFVYEAKICSIKDGSCTVEFLGYGDKETVNLTDLLESGGKKARKRQNKAALAGFSTASDSCLDTTDGETESRRSCSAMKNINENQVNHAPFDYSAAENSFQVPLPLHADISHHHAIANHHHAAATHHHAAANHHHAATCYAPSAVPRNLPLLPTPPAPPMPQCASVTQNPALSAMLVSWYMAGYYTGLHQGQKDSKCSQHCCSHANKCCH